MIDGTHFALFVSAAAILALTTGPGILYVLGRSLHGAHAFLWQRGSMVDLNTLIPPDSGLQLVYAEAINDAGEIVGIGVPPGVSPADVETLGHAYVLIPQSESLRLSGQSG